MIQYVILEDLGILSKNDLDNYCTVDGILGVHPDYGNPGIEALQVHWDMGCQW